MGIYIISVLNPPKEKLSWRDVFDMKKFYGHYDAARKAAKEAGYTMLAFNDRVYHVDDPDIKEICSIGDLR